MEPVLVGVGADGDAINAILDLANEPGANGTAADIRQALAPAWETLGISESDIGTLDGE